MPNVSLYRKEYCKMVDEYLEKCKDDFRNPKIKKVQLPTVGGFARFLNLGKPTLYKYADKHVDFRLALDKIILEQKERLINEGLGGNYNHTICKLILSSDHGMSDRHDHTTNGKDLPTPIINVSTDEGDE